MKSNRTYVLLAICEKLPQSIISLKKNWRFRHRFCQKSYGHFVTKKKDLSLDCTNKKRRFKKYFFVLWISTQNIWIQVLGHLKIYHRILHICSNILTCLTKRRELKSHSKIRMCPYSYVSKYGNKNETHGMWLIIYCHQRPTSFQTKYKKSSVQKSGFRVKYISNNHVIVLPLQFGTILIYSGDLLTHQEQRKRKRKRKEIKQFMNAIKYSSKKICNHLIISLSRKIKENSRCKWINTLR